MPWKGLRPNSAGGRKGRQQSVRQKSDDASQLSSPVENTGEQSVKPTTALLDSTPDEHATALPPCPSPLPFDKPMEGLKHSLTNREVPSLFQRRTALSTTPRNHRFSLLRSRHASDPQLSKSYAAAAPTLTPPLPSAPGK